MRKSLKIFFWVLTTVFVLIQFFRIDKTNPPIDAAIDFQQAAHPPTEVLSIFKNACYDCHSYESKFPWYANVAPASWMLADHIKEGREHLNFSTWGSYSAQDLAEIRDDAAEEINGGDMPLPNYTWMHPEARLTDAQRTTLVNWLENSNSGGNENSSMPLEEEDDED